MDTPELVENAHYVTWEVEPQGFVFRLYRADATPLAAAVFPLANMPGIISSLLNMTEAAAIVRSAETGERLH